MTQHVACYIRKYTQKHISVHLQANESGTGDSEMSLNFHSKHDSSEFFSLILQPAVTNAKCNPHESASDWWYEPLCLGDGEGIPMGNTL